MLLMAVSTDNAFKSGIFCVAISRTCFSVTLPIVSLFGVPEPLAMPAAFFSSRTADLLPRRSRGVVRDKGKSNPFGAIQPIVGRVVGTLSKPNSLKIGRKSFDIWRLFAAAPPGVCSGKTEE
jgi:hypothetical protein